MSVARTAGIVVATAAISVLTAALSRAPWRLAADDQAVIRLSWAGRPERLEVCRRLSEAELAERPVHMRQAVECAGTSASYRFEVVLDQSMVDAGVLRGGGFRRDRPIYLLRDLPVPPGDHRLRIALTRIEQPQEDSTEAGAGVAGLSLDRSVREAEERARRRLEALPPALEIERSVTLQPRQVLLVTYDSESRTLVLRSGPGPAPQAR